jgi:hypothetical protein
MAVTPHHITCLVVANLIQGVINCVPVKETDADLWYMLASVSEGEKMPTDKLVDVSPLALRMSSPFNAGYWLTAA